MVSFCYFGTSKIKNNNLFDFFCGLPGFITLEYTKKAQGLKNKYEQNSKRLPFTGFKRKGKKEEQKACFHK